MQIELDDGTGRKRDEVDCNTGHHRILHTSMHGVVERAALGERRWRVRVPCLIGEDLPGHALS
jgi:hypothetical protein